MLYSSIDMKTLEWVGHIEMQSGLVAARRQGTG